MKFYLTIDDLNNVSREFYDTSFAFIGVGNNKLTNDEIFQKRETIIKNASGSEDFYSIEFCLDCPEIITENELEHYVNRVLKDNNLPIYFELLYNEKSVLNFSIMDGRFIAINQSILFGSNSSNSFVDDCKLLLETIVSKSNKNNKEQKDNAKLISEFNSGKKLFDGENIISKKDGWIYNNSEKIFQKNDKYFRLDTLRLVP